MAPDERGRRVGGFDHCRIGLAVEDQDELVRVDETWFRLLEWTRGQTDSERLAAQLLDHEDYENLDPSHPLGGKDGGRDGECTYKGEKAVWAVYFPRGQQTLTTIKNKLTSDITEAKKHAPRRIAFVTNQELTLGERKDLRAVGGDIEMDLFHLERVAMILDRPLMAPVREQYLKIAAGPIPMLIKASVFGNAYGFSDDAEVLDFFVEMYAKDVREESDKGHARVNAEREAEAREMQQRRDRAAAERRRARTERPWDIASQIDFGAILGNSSIMDSLITAYQPPDLGQMFPGMTGEKPKPPEPLSDEQIQERVDQYRAELVERWPSCQDYLAGIAWSGLQFRIKNEAKSFLKDVQVILTFHGAVGATFRDLSEFAFEKVSDPSWQPPTTLYGSSYIPPLKLRRPADYPITWGHNDDGELEVTITLPSLRPHPEWRSDAYDDDVVLVVAPEVEIDQVVVTYTATAQGYGDIFEGEATPMPVQRVDMFEVVGEVLNASRDAS